jgi:hypothetical protein
MLGYFRRLRWLFFSPAGHQFLPGWLLRPGHWLWGFSLVALALTLFSSPLTIRGALLSLVLLLLAVQLARVVARRGPGRLRRLLLYPALLLLALLPLALLLSYIGILTEPYFFNSRRLNRTLRGQNHLAYRPPRGIRTDPVPFGLLLGALVLILSSKQVRSTPLPRQEKYSEENWDRGHWENVEVLGDEHSDAAAEFYLDRASAAIRITFTTPVLDYYLERLIQFDEGVHWWFADRPPLFYGQKPFRAHCWGGVPRYAPRDLYFIDPSGPPPQYHPKGGYHPLWVARQASLMLAKEPPAELRLGFSRPLWLPPGPVRPPTFRPLAASQRQQRLLQRLEDDSYRERIEKILGRFRSRETTLTAMQHYLYHPDAQGERDHRHMRIRQHLDEQDELDRLADAAQVENDLQQLLFYQQSCDAWEEELFEFEKEIREDFNAIPLLERTPREYSLWELRPFVPYSTAPLHGA